MCSRAPIENTGAASRRCHTSIALSLCSGRCSRISRAVSQDQYDVEQGLFIVEHNWPSCSQAKTGRTDSVAGQHRFKAGLMQSSIDCQRSSHAYARSTRLT
eukprot:10380782-Alexandrium_andersonii.AAC.1